MNENISKILPPLQGALRFCVHVVIFSIVNEGLCALMVQRKQEPFASCWALPTTEVDTTMDDSLEQSASRILKQFTGLDTPYLEQVLTIGNQSRDPRGWSVGVVYYCLVANHQLANSLLLPIRWMNTAQVGNAILAFDHAQVLESCLARFQNKSLYTSLPIFLLKDEFTLTELQKAYEVVLGFKMEKKSFRRRLLDAHFLEETGNSRRANHRPAQLYRLAQPQPYFFARIIEGARSC